MSDEFKNATKGIESPFEAAFNIAPDDTNDLPHASRGVYVGSSGNMNVVLVGMNTPVLFRNMVGGQFYPFRIKQVLASDTSASDLVALV